jgi:hypothetical protein
MTQLRLTHVFCSCDAMNLDGEYPDRISILLMLAKAEFLSECRHSLGPR